MSASQGEYKKATILTFIPIASSSPTTTITAAYAVQEAYRHHRTLVSESLAPSSLALWRPREAHDSTELEAPQYPRAVRADAHSETGVGVTACFYLLLYIAL